MPNDGLIISKIFEEMEANKEKLFISDWGISQTSLEDVFLKIVEK